MQSLEDVLEKAAKLINEEGFLYRKAADYFGIDKMTLMRFKKKKEANPNCAVGYKSTSIKNRIISPDMEKDLATHIGYLAGMYFGLSFEKSKELAFEYAVKNNVVVSKSWIRCKKAGTQLWLGFKKRQNLSIRAPEATSIGQTSGFNEPVVKE